MSLRDDICNVGILLCCIFKLCALQLFYSKKHLAKIADDRYTWTISQLHYIYTLYLEIPEELVLLLARFVVP